MRIIRTSTRRVPQVILSCVLLCIINACETEPTLPPESPRTVLIYMVAQNNLSNNAVKDLNEIKTAVIAGDLGDSRLLIYIDRNSYDPQLIEYDNSGNAQVLKQYNAETLSVSVERMSQVVDDAKNLAPAQHYSMIMWGHGTGYVQDGIEEQNTISPLSYGGEKVNGTHYWMNTTSMAKALEGKGLDWIYFDCCFMAGVEVAYELRHVSPYIIASATEIPADGMPYDHTLKHLMPANSDLVGAADETYRYYNAVSGMYRTCTMSVIKTEAMDQLASAMRIVYTNTSGLPDDYQPQAFQTDDDKKLYGWSYYDLKHYATALAGENIDYMNIINRAMDEVVIHAVATPKLWNEVSLTNHSGLSTLIIENADDPEIDNKGYRQLSWWSDVVEWRFK